MATSDVRHPESSEREGKRDRESKTSREQAGVSVSMEGICPEPAIKRKHPSKEIGTTISPNSPDRQHP